MVKRYIGGIISATPPTVAANSTGVFAGIAQAIQYVQTGAFPRPPDPPTNVSAVRGNGQATITFSAPANTGGSPITSYKVVSTPGNITAAGSSSPITITGLTNYVSYTFTITAINGVGEGSGAISNSVIPVVPVRSFEYLVVGGGAGGGATRGGGGGAGGYISSTYTVPPTSNISATITVGGGGAGAVGAPTPLGSPGTFSRISIGPTHIATSSGGGGGGTFGSVGDPGGSGGGGGGSGGTPNGPRAGGSGTPGQGNNGGSMTLTGATNAGGGGGGGAGAAGTPVTSQAGPAGPGGNGLQWLNGSYYAGGGGGGEYQTSVAGTGGLGGGGNGASQGSPSTTAVDGSPGEINTGGGGGGGSGNGGEGGSGGSGVVILRYSNTSANADSTSGTFSLTESGGYKYYTFTGSGTITFS